MLILGIETSCDETGVAVYDAKNKKLLAHHLFSQIKEHQAYGGVVPEIASRSQLEKIHPIFIETLARASITINDIDVIAVTNTPGLAGSLFVGVCYAKGIAWALGKKLIGINHLEGHIYSSFLGYEGHFADLLFPHICLSASGGHTSMYLVEDFGVYHPIGATIDDAAGEAFDKVAKLLGFGYPGGPMIEQLACAGSFIDYFKYPRTKNINDEIFFSFSGIKTAVLYDLVKRGAYDFKYGQIAHMMTPELQQHVASSLLVCITDIFENNIRCALKKYPHVKAVTFTGGVACNNYMRNRLNDYCHRREKKFVAAPKQFCGDNAAMIAFVGTFKAEQSRFDDLRLDINP
jgi:N6-L-threonylcarbamoyladenine synthase